VSDCRASECDVFECGVSDCGTSECDVFECGVSECDVSECGMSECDVSECGVSDCGASECGVSECDRVSSIKWMPWPTRGCCVVKNNSVPATQRTLCIATKIYTSQYRLGT